MINEIPGFSAYAGLLPELKLTLILIGAEERSRRNADRIGRRILWVAICALAVAIISLAVSLIATVGA
jgi:hypothetical protein